MHTYTYALVTSDLNLEPEVAWGKVMSWMETDRLIQLGTGHWPLLMTHKELCLCLSSLSSSSSSSSQQTHPLFFHWAFFLLSRSKVINIVTFWLLLFFFLSTSLYPPVFFHSYAIIDGHDDSNGPSFWLGLKVIPIVGRIFYDVKLKVCNWAEFKLITHWYRNSWDDILMEYLAKLFVLGLHLTHWCAEKCTATHSPSTADTQEARQIQEQMHRYLIRTDCSCYCLLPRHCERLKYTQTYTHRSTVCLRWLPKGASAVCFCLNSVCVCVCVHVSPNTPTLSTSVQGYRSCHVHRLLYGNSFLSSLTEALWVGDHKRSYTYITSNKLRAHSLHMHIHTPDGLLLSFILFCPS